MVIWIKIGTAQYDQVIIRNKARPFKRLAKHFSQTYLAYLFNGEGCDLMPSSTEDLHNT